MSQKQDNMIVVLDIGSAHTRVLAADLNEGSLRFRGHGVVESAGMRKGLISDLSPAAKAVKAANEQAENMARVNIDLCAVGVGELDAGDHIGGVPAQRDRRRVLVDHAVVHGARLVVTRISRHDQVTAHDGGQLAVLHDADVD